MSITDELREYIGDNSYPYYNGCAGGVSISELLAIADRIDAEHERLMQEQPCAIDMVPMTDEQMAEHGWVRGPIGGDYKPMAKGHAVVDSGGNVGVIVETRYSGDANWVVLVDFGEGESCRFTWFLPRRLCHHKQPSVEDMLREFAQCWDDPMHYAKGELVEQYAAKLREMLAGDAE